jgi:hypothetical protein
MPGHVVRFDGNAPAVRGVRLQFWHGPERSRRKLRLRFLGVFVSSPCAKSDSNPLTPLGAVPRPVLNLRQRAWVRWRGFVRCRRWWRATFRMRSWTRTRTVGPGCVMARSSRRSEGGAWVCQPTLNVPILTTLECPPCYDRSVPLFGSSGKCRFSVLSPSRRGYGKAGIPRGSRVSKRGG